MALPIITPPRALQAKTAETLHASFNAMSPITVTELAATAEVVFCVRDCDADVSNIKALNLEADSVRPLGNVVQQRSFCTVHQFNMVAGKQLVSGSPTMSSGSKGASSLVTGFFNCSHLLRNPGYSEMMLDAIEPVIARMLQPRQGEPNPHQDCITACDNYDCFATAIFSYHVNL